MRILLICALLAATTEAGSQERQEGDTLKYELDEMVIVGTRTVEKIIDIPYSVFRVDKKELGFGKKVSAKDVLADVPGLFLQSRYGTHDLRISIRGFGTRSNSGVRGVRILQDGLPESEPDGETVIDAIDLSSLGGVEVVKGNLSSLYANAPGGVINFISDLDFPESYITALNEVGRFGYRQNGFRLGLRGNTNRYILSYHYRNLNSFRRHGDEYQHLINSIYEENLQGGAVLTVLGNYVQGFVRIPGPLTAQEFDRDPFQAQPAAVSQDFRKMSKKGRVGIRYVRLLGETGANEIEISGYGGIKELEQADNESYSIATRYSLGTLLHWSNRTEVLGRRNACTLGMDFAYQTGPVAEFENQYGVRGISVQNDYIGSLGNIGFYGIDHLNIAPELLDLFVSGRYDRDVFRRDILIPYGFRDDSRSFDKFTPKVGLNYKIHPTIAVYGSYGLSYDFPALAELTNTPLSSNITLSLNPDLEAQTSTNLELGVKGNLLNPRGEFFRKLFFEITFFSYRIDNEIIPFVINQKTYFRNASRTRRMGVEMGLKGEPVEGIECTMNYTFTRFRYDDYVAMVYTPAGYQTETYTGNVVPSVPDHILNLILNYEFEISENLSGLLQWDCDYIGRMQVNDANSVASAGYFYGNTMVGVQWAEGALGGILFAGMNNVFDRRYVGFININDYYGRYFETGEPRNLYSGLNLSFRF